MALLVKVDVTAIAPNSAATAAPASTCEVSAGAYVVRMCVPDPAAPKAAVTAVATPSVWRVSSSAVAAIVTLPPVEVRLPPETRAVIEPVSLLAIVEIPIEPPYTPPATATAATPAWNVAVCVAVIDMSPPAVITASPSTAESIVLVSVLRASAPPAAKEEPLENEAAAAQAWAVTSSIAVASIVSRPRAWRMPPETYAEMSSVTSFRLLATPTVTAPLAGAMATAPTAPMTLTASVSSAAAEIVTAPLPDWAVVERAFTDESLTKAFTELETIFLA